MQAVQTVGSMRYQRRYRSKHAITVSVFKKLIIPVVLIFTIMFAVFFPTGADVTDDIVMSANVSTSMAQGAAHTLYMQTATEGAPETGEVNQVAPGGWWVTEDELNDVRGNACTILNFCIYEWGNAKTWLQQNYVEGWPHGPVKESREPVTFSPVIAAGIVANAMRESSCTPATIQNGSDFDYRTATSAEVIAELRTYVGVSGKAWGIIQWDGGRRDNFVTFCDVSGYDPRSLQTQLYYLAYEYYASSEYSNYATVFETYQSADYVLSTTQNAAELYRKKVERGGKERSADAILDNWGNKWSPSWGDKPGGGLFQYLKDYMETGVVAR